MSNNPYNHYPLIDAYVEGTLSNEEEGILLELLKADKNAVRLLRANVLVDFLLKENYQTEIDLNSISDLSLGHQELSWDELIALQNREKPCRARTDNSSDHMNSLEGMDLFSRCKEQCVTFFRKCFLPNKRDMQESIIPVVALLLIVFSSAMLILWSFERTASLSISESIPEEIPVSIAKVVNVLDPVWSDEFSTYQRGQLVNEANFQLKSGMIQIEMVNGVSLIANGPVNFTINNAMNVFCQNGQISTHVPPKAVGFEITTPFGQIIDRGTDFYIEVTKQQAIVDVVKGQVDFLSPDKQLVSLFMKQAIQFDLVKKITRCPPLSAYIDRPVFNTMVTEKEQVIQKEKEKEASAEDRNPNLLVHFDFSRKENTFPNKALAGREMIPFLSVEDPRWTNGELSITDALAFTSINQEAYLNWPGKWTTFTIKAMVRLDKFARAGNVLLISDNYLNVPGTFQWQISHDGRLQFYVTNQKGSNAQFETLPVVTKDRINTWIEVAVAFNKHTGTISHYFNGRKVGVNPLRDIDHITPGNCRLGTCIGGKRNFGDRFLTGAISDLKIYKK